MPAPILTGWTCPGCQHVIEHSARHDADVLCPRCMLFQLGEFEPAFGPGPSPDPADPRPGEYLDLHGHWRDTDLAGQSVCVACGMPVHGGSGGFLTEFHPWIACQIFIATHDSRTVHANLYAVLRFGSQLDRVDRIDGPE